MLYESSYGLAARYVEDMQRHDAEDDLPSTRQGNLSESTCETSGSVSVIH